jgi:tetratricopeptide (TPR) repeat protein
MVLTMAGPVDSAKRALLEMGLQVHSPEYQNYTHSGLAGLALLHGRLTEAERERTANQAILLQRGLPGQALGAEVNRARVALFFTGDSAAALRILQDALAKSPLKSIPPLDRPYGAIATVYAMAGRTAEAKRLLTEAESAVPEGNRRGDANWYLARGWVALAEGKPKEALAEFRDVGPKGQRAEWGHWEAGLAFDRANLPDSALAEYRIAGDSIGSGFKMQVAPWVQAPSLKRLGEIYEARGDKTRAIESYTRFVDLWKDADPVLQPAVREVKDRLAKLAGEAK